MFATCLFCKSALGRNEALEYFPVGRRLAYDEAKGRLWVVCRRCERWNLSPLETRWEAIEEAERAFRATRQRIATDNIGLARLNEGLELVRIGAPPRLELAVWRYGDQFGRRRRKAIALASLGPVIGFSPLLISSAPMLGSLGVGAAVVGCIASVSHSFAGFRKNWRDSRVPTVFLTNGDGEVLGLTERDTRTAKLVPKPATREWHLQVRHRVPEPSPRPRRFALAHARQQALQPAIIKGDAALRALAALLPHTNAEGASVRRVREAVSVIESASSIDQLVFHAAVSNSSRDAAIHASLLHRVPENVRLALERRAESTWLDGVPETIRLALEMLVHEDDEQRAMAGELAALEERWREAEEIAAIADGLLVPDDTDARVEALKGKLET